MKREVWEKIGGSDEGLEGIALIRTLNESSPCRIQNMYCPTSVIIDHGAHSKYTNLNL